MLRQSNQSPLWHVVCAIIGERLWQNPYIILLLSAIFLTITANMTFFARILAIQNLTFMFSSAIVLIGLIFLLLLVLCYRWNIKPVLMLVLMLSAVTGHFTDTYATVYDTNMLQNALQTDHAEARDLLNIAFALRIALLGILPCFVIAKLPLKYPKIKQSLWLKPIFIILALVITISPIVAFSRSYASFFREHKPVRYYANPVMPIYSVGKLMHIHYKSATRPTSITTHATDAIQINNMRKPRLIVMVVGETARADHVGFADGTGYHRITFPQLSTLSNLANFRQVTSCGTSTAYSVPCMFSYLGMAHYDVDSAPYHENVLDTLHRLGIQILWRDNNSDDKGVMARLPKTSYQNYKSPPANAICDHTGECRDVGMLAGLDDYVANTVASTPNQDILIVLHQMGNHGPAYYKRYDKEFAIFHPECQSNELATCSSEQIHNAYDNALLATDDFLKKTIDWLKSQQDSHEVAMLYASDHGESLGENGIYLHGMPNAIAPKEQRHIPVFVWLGDDMPFVAINTEAPISHDAISPTLLSLFDVQSTVMDNKATFVKRIQP